MTWATGALARFMAGLTPDALPDATLETARRCLFDLLGVAVAGRSTPAATAARGAASALFAPGGAGVWLEGTGLVPAGAAFANAAAASALDLDDGHRGAGGHPGAAIVPAVLAVAEAAAADDRAVLAALVIGYEVAVRVGAARDFDRLDTLATGRWCGIGAAAAAAWLARLPEPVAAEAMAIAGVEAPGLSAAGYSARMGNSVKEGIPWATATGLVAVDLARRGFTGPTDLLDHPGYFSREVLLDGLGERFAVDGVYFKPYACCRWIHGAIDAVLAVQAAEGLPGEAIAQVEVHTFGRALRLNNYADPDTLESAQYSLPFCVAAAALRGSDALMPMDPRLLHDPEVVGLAGRVVLVVDPALDAAFPARTPARVVLEARGRRYAHEVKHPQGDPANPMDAAALDRKFERLTVPCLGADRAAALARAIGSLGDGRGVGRLTALLAGPPATR